MNINFDDIKKGLKKAVNVTKEKSETAVEYAKLKYKLVEINSAIEDNYKKIGKLVYHAADNGDITGKLRELCDEITALNEKKEDMQENYNEITNKKFCPECDAKIDKQYEFCPKCGKNFEE